MSTGAGNPGMQRGQIIQALDNVTWTRGNHTFKFGADFKRLTDHDDNVYGNYRSGWYVFDGSSDVGQNIGDPYTAFLLGYPDYTEVSSTNNPTMDGLGYAYAFFGQDDWKVTPNLTLNLGLRYELHPPLREINHNTAIFSPIRPSHRRTASRSTAPLSFPTRRPCRSRPPISPPPSRPRPYSPPHRPDSRGSLRYTDHTDWVRASALPGGPTATTEPSSAAVGAASSRRRSAFRWSPAGPSTPATCPPTTRTSRRGTTHAAALACRSLQPCRRQLHRHRWLLLRLSHPLSRSLCAAVEPDPRAGPRP